MGKESKDAVIEMIAPSAKWYDCRQQQRCDHVFAEDLELGKAVPFRVAGRKMSAKDPDDKPGRDRRAGGKNDPQTRTPTDQERRHQQHDHLKVACCNPKLRRQVRSVSRKHVQAFVG
jgi:hypothetical protein